MKGLIWIALLGLLLAAIFALFPSFAEETFRLQAFGWVLETRQGPLLLALVVLAFAWRIVRIALGGAARGPGKLWNAMRLGSSRRRIRKLRRAVEDWINDDRPIPPKLAAQAEGVAPPWLLRVLAALSTPGTDARLPEQSDADALLVAATARAISDPDQPHTPDPAERRRALEAWLAHYPDALVAHERLAHLAEETGDWETAEREIGWLQEHGAHVYARLAPRLADAWVERARQASPQEARRMLRRALRVVPDHEQAALALAELLARDGERRAAREVLEALLERRTSFAAARAWLALADRPEAAWKRWAKRDVARLNPAQAWLAAMLAHRAGLAEAARARMQKLADEGIAEAWAMLARWAEDADPAQAARLYRKALVAAGVSVEEEDENTHTTPAPQANERDEATSGLAETRNGPSS